MNTSDAKDYDEWARLVNDKRWSWSGSLPYFRKTEHHHDPNADRQSTASTVLFKPLLPPHQDGIICFVNLSK